MTRRVGRDVAGRVRGRPVLGPAPARRAGRPRPPARRAGRDRPRRPAGPAEVARHQVTSPGSPRLDDSALPARPARGAEPRAEGPHQGRGRVPRDRRRRRPVAGRGRRGRRLPGPVQDGRGPSSSPPCTGRGRSTGRSGRPPRRAGSPTATSPRSSPTRRRPPPASRPGPGSPAPSPRAPAAGPPRDGQEAGR